MARKNYLFVLGIVFVLVFLWSGTAVHALQIDSVCFEGLSDIRDLAANAAGNVGRENFTLALEQVTELRTLAEEIETNCAAALETADTPDGEAALFTVTANGNINMRSCAGTNCAVVGQAADGSTLTVLETETATEGEWYRVQSDGGEAWVAGWLTTRGPDTVIDISEPYMDLATGCMVAFDYSRGDPRLHVIITGAGMEDTEVDVFLPGQSQPLPVDAQYDKAFIDTGDLYIDQFYRWNVPWSPGLYQLEIRFDGQTSRLGWELDRQGDYAVYVVCQRG
jgi:uncharacterized protein YraI